MFGRSCYADKSANKRELVNKFANCIGDVMGHLVLSAPIFAIRIRADENYFQIKISSGKRNKRLDRGDVYDIDVRAPSERLVEIKSVIASSKRCLTAAISSCAVQAPSGDKTGWH